MIRIAICDDEKETIIEHEIIIKSILSHKKIVANVFMFQSGEFLLYDFNEDIYYDLVLLDIEMPKKSGIDIAKKIKEISPNTLIIFITSHSKYAIESFELSIFRYIPKDNIKQKLINAIEDALKYIKLQMDKTYVICTATRFEKISFNNIIYVQKDGKYSMINTFEGETQIRKSLNKVFEELNSEVFVYIDRAFFVNLIHIMKFDNNEVVMNNGVYLPVSKKRFRELKEILNKYWRNHL